MNIIFIPGLVCDERVWGELNSLRNIYNCYDADVSNHNTILSMSQSIQQKFIEQLNEACVVGVSMGGYVAIDLAIRLGRKLKKLVLLNTTANEVDQSTVVERQKCIEFARNGKFDEVIKSGKGQCFHTKNEMWDELIKDMALIAGAETYIKQQSAIINRQSYVDYLPTISAHTLIISGREDAVINSQDSYVMANKIKNADLIMLNNCGHLSTLERSSLVTKFVTISLEVKNELFTL